MIIASGQEIGIPCAGRKAGPDGWSTAAVKGKFRELLPSPGFRAEGLPNRRTAKDSRNPPAPEREPQRYAPALSPQRSKRGGVGGRILGISTGGQQSRSAFAPVGSSRGQRFSEFRGESTPSRFSVQQPCRQAVVSVLKFGGPSFSDFLPPAPAGVV